MKPKITIISITYNHERFIENTLNSFVSQKTNFPFQVVISDDCSTDGTREIIEKYALKYPDLIIPIYREKNLGAMQNFIATLDLIKTKYVVYCEGDDCFCDPYKLEKQVLFLEQNEEFSICFHPVKVVVEGDEKSTTIFPSPWYRFDKTTLDLQDLIKRNFIQTNSAMYRWRFSDKSSSLKEIFPEDIIPGDWYLHLLHAQIGKIGMIDEVMAIYQRHSGGIWWESLKNIERHNLKYGLETIQFYLAVWRNFSLNKEEYFENTIINLFEEFIGLFLKYGEFDKLQKLSILDQTAYNQAVKNIIDFFKNKEVPLTRMPVKKLKERELKLFGLTIFSKKKKKEYYKIKLLGIPILKVK